MRNAARLNRRTFLKTAAAAAAAPYVVSASALGAGDKPAPSNRVAMALIGCGGQGTGVMNAFLHLPDTQVLATCDANKQRRLAAKKLIEDYYAAKKAADYKGCQDYNDFRELLARPDIDAVIVGTPDHWHALPTIAAARAGKDVYCEKPLCLTVQEGRAMADAIKRYGRVFQHGTQQRSDRNFRHAAELALNGRLGKLTLVTVAAPASSPGPKLKEEPVPEGFDYNFWLGQAPLAPYMDVICMKTGWYHMSPYTPGFISGWGVHHVDSAHWGMGTDLTGPVELEGWGEFPKEGIYDSAVKWDLNLVYPGGLKMHFVSDNILPHGVRFEGTDGWVHVVRGAINAEPKSLLAEKFGPNDKRLIDSNHHQANLVQSIKTRQPTVCPIEVAHRSTTVCQISDITIRLKRKMKWDPEKERFIGDDEANRMLSRAMRPPWSL
jgi:predicted dehydrogenase